MHQLERTIVAHLRPDPAALSHAASRIAHVHIARPNGFHGSAGGLPCPSVHPCRQTGRRWPSLKMDASWRTRRLRPARQHCYTEHWAAFGLHFLVVQTRPTQAQFLGSDVAPKADTAPPQCTIAHTGLGGVEGNPPFPPHPMDDCYFIDPGCSLESADRTSTQVTRRANRKKRLTVLYIVEHPNQEGDTCIDWTSQYCWTNGWNCEWRGHSAFSLSEPTIDPPSAFDACPLANPLMPALT